MEFGKRIKSIRTLRGYSQEYIALKLGVTQQTYSVFEKRASDKSIFTIFRLAEILDVDICLFFAYDIPINKNTIGLRFSEVYYRVNLINYNKSLIA